nr:TetR/AcrR family transcriptional regulator [Micromonospora sp. DSM 115978]
STAATPRRPAVRTAGPRRAAAIADAALRLFAERGYQATTMDDLGAAVGVRGPSLYKHVRSKQALLADLMTTTMETLTTAHDLAVGGTADPVERLRRAVEAHVRYHARHRLEAFVGNREIRSLVEPHLSTVLALRDAYEQRFRRLVADGMAAGVFDVPSARLASYAVLDLGMGLAAWYRADGDMTEDEVVYAYGGLALRLVGAR